MDETNPDHEKWRRYFQLGLTRPSSSQSGKRHTSGLLDTPPDIPLWGVHIGNPQHHPRAVFASLVGWRHGDRIAAVDEAKVHELPASKVRIALGDASPDSFAFAAVIALRCLARDTGATPELTEGQNQRIEVVAADQRAPRKWSPADPIQEVSDIQVLWAVARNGELTPLERLQRIGDWIERGRFEGYERVEEQLRRDRYELIELLPEVSVKRGIAGIETRSPLAVEACGFYADVGICIDPGDHRGGVPHRRFTIFTTRHGRVDMDGLVEELNAIWQGWRRRTWRLLTLSVEGEAAELSLPRLREIVAQHLPVLYDSYTVKPVEAGSTPPDQAQVSAGGGVVWGVGLPLEWDAAYGPNLGSARGGASSTALEDSLTVEPPPRGATLVTVAGDEKALQAIVVLFIRRFMLNIGVALPAEWEERIAQLVAHAQVANWTLGDKRVTGPHLVEAVAGDKDRSVDSRIHDIGHWITDGHFRGERAVRERIKEERRAMTRLAKLTHLLTFPGKPPIARLVSSSQHADAVCLLLADAGIVVDPEFRGEDGSLEPHRRTRIVLASPEVADMDAVLAILNEREPWTTTETGGASDGPSTLTYEEVAEILAAHMRAER